MQLFRKFSLTSAEQVENLDSRQNCDCGAEVNKLMHSLLLITLSGAARRYKIIFKQQKPKALHGNRLKT